MATLAVSSTLEHGSPPAGGQKTAASNLADDENACLSYLSNTGGFGLAVGRYGIEFTTNVLAKQLLSKQQTDIKTGQAPQAISNSSSLTVANDQVVSSEDGYDDLSKGASLMATGATAAGCAVGTVAVAGSCAIPLATIVGAGGVVAGAYGVGVTGGGAIKAKFPDLQPAVNDFTDRLMNGNPSSVETTAPDLSKSATYKDLNKGVPLLATGSSISLLATATTVAVGSTAAFPVAATVCAGGAAIAACGVGIMIGEATKLFVPDLQPAVNDLADRLINGKDTFAPESNVATSTTETPRFAPKVSEQSAKPLSPQGKVEEGSDLSLSRASTQRNSPIAHANEREID